jgi:hypothetical protein
MALSFDVLSAGRKRLTRGVLLHTKARIAVARAFRVWSNVDGNVPTLNIVLDSNRANHSSSPSTVAVRSKMMCLS